MLLPGRGAFLQNQLLQVPGEVADWTWLPGWLGVTDSLIPALGLGCN